MKPKLVSHGQVDNITWYKWDSKEKFPRKKGVGYTVTQKDFYNHLYAIK